MESVHIASGALLRCARHQDKALECRDAARLSRNRAKHCTRASELAELVREARRCWWRAENEVAAAVDYLVQVVGDDQVAHRAMSAAREAAWVAGEYARQAHGFFLEAEAIEQKARELEQERLPRRFTDARVFA